MMRPTASPPTKILDLPDEILLQIIEHHHLIPSPAPRLFLSSPHPADGAVLKLTCKRLNTLTHAVEDSEGKIEPVTMFISRPLEIEQLLSTCRPHASDRVQRLVFTNTGCDQQFAIPGNNNTGHEDQLQREWKDAVPALIGELTKCIKNSRETDSKQLLPRLQAIDIWPNTKVIFALHASPQTENAPSRECSPYEDSLLVQEDQSTSLTSKLFAALVPLARLLDVELSLHCLPGYPDLHISAMPPMLNITAPLTHLPCFSHRINTDCVAQSEKWTLVVSAEAKLGQNALIKRILGLVAGIDRRMMVSRSLTPLSKARVFVCYSASTTSMAQRQELVHLIRQGVVGLMGAYRVSTDLQSCVQIDV